jgi:hypothetical protein
MERFPPRPKTVAASAVEAERTLLELSGSLARRTWAKPLASDLARRIVHARGPSEVSWELAVQRHFALCSLHGARTGATDAAFRGAAGKLAFPPGRAGPSVAQRGAILEAELDEFLAPLRVAYPPGPVK